mmetsp:Transcript_27922/g.70041  ORF Transcript_27922/g.70041 Transcript_27922/m.70041 type:complete len:93 (+) Transcript_27922:109-387(+)|eukprot:CAMPEP_0177659936 /NCGR_PEP_ID=MMETSP0447-20121125/17726_1 /TAXON_ID=0 /ORGANISM="Stygamoeba regulata, Strain BSH-02190019" /LENGTH=92 /DNA_ID=CAMNT_0019164875 /DNA_START=109 /DNA_END=387 /DNA_ORIENTATION=-
MNQLGGGNPKCPNCGKSVYHAERVHAVGKYWHKFCLKCTKCQVRIEKGKELDHGGEPYCKPCYDGAIKPAGYGSGGLSSFTGRGEGDSELIQ